MEPRTTLVFAGGEHLDAAPGFDASFVIAADSGLDAARAAGIGVDLVVGDMDSVSAGALLEARSSRVAVEEHPRDKEATDLELALRAAATRGAERIVVVGGWGGRFDHLLANTLLLAAPFLDGISLEWRSHSRTVHRVGPGRRVTVDTGPGDCVSLIPLASRVGGVTTSGLRWPLDGAELRLGSTRGISNEATAEAVTVTVGSGNLLVVHERSTES